MTTTTTLLPENTVVGDLGADDATDNSSAVHSHTQLKSGTRLMLHNEKVMIKCSLSNVPFLAACF